MWTEAERMEVLWGLDEEFPKLKDDCRQRQIEGRAIQALESTEEWT